jgi:hypothetical protein
MPIRLTTLRRHRWLASIAVLAFALRALIPAGFMPGGNGTFALQICPDGFPTELLASTGDHSAHAAHHHHHATGAGQAGSAAVDPSPGMPAHDHQSWTGHCIFSAVAGAPPPSHALTVTVVEDIAAASIESVVAAVLLDIRFRIAQPRAPPHLV